MARAFHKRAAFCVLTSGEKESHIDGFRKAFSDLYEAIDYAEKKVRQIQRILARFYQARRKSDVA